MTYGILLWGNSADRNSIFVLQKRAIRAIYGLGPRESLRERFKKINILTMPCQYIFECIMYARKHLIKFKKCGDSQTLVTRNKDRLILPITRLSKVSKSFTINCVRFYNYLPHNLTNLTTRRFKSTLKLLLLQRAYYSVNEFISDKKSWHKLDIGYNQNVNFNLNTM